MELPYTKDNVPPRSHKLPNEKVQCHMQNTSSSWSGQWCPRNSQIIKIMVTALAWPPELNAKILLLKTLHKVVKGMEKSKLVPIRKLPSCRLAFQILKVLCRLLWVLQTTVTGVVSCAHGCSSGGNSMEVASWFLVGFKVDSTVGNVCTVLEIWPWAHGEGAHRLQEWTYHLINGHNIKLSPAFASLYPYIAQLSTSPEKLLCVTDSS